MSTNTSIIEIEARSDDLMKLNEDFLAELEEAAKHRYTEKDEEYMTVQMKCVSVPPLLPVSSYPVVHHGRGSVGRGRGSYHNHRRERNNYYNNSNNEYRNSNYYGGRDGSEQYNSRSEKRPYDRDESEQHNSRGEKRPYDRDESEQHNSRGEKRSYDRD